MKKLASVAAIAALAMSAAACGDDTDDDAPTDEEPVEAPLGS
jgi:hypothetical protein